MPDPADDAAEPAPARRPRPAGAPRTLLLVAATVTVAEALALVTLAVLDLTDLSPDRAGVGIGVAVLLLVYAGALVFAAVKVLGGSLAARSPLVVAQLLQALLAWNFRGDTWWIPTVLAGSAILCLACLLAPPVGRALGASGGSQGNGSTGGEGKAV